MVESLKPGFYEARAIAGSEQYGVAGTGTAQVAIDLEVSKNRMGIGRMTTVLSFGGAAAPFAIERLRLLGWEGSDVTRLDGIDRNLVPVEIRQETFEGRTQLRCEIRTGQQTFKLQNVMTDEERESFAANVIDMLGVPPKEKAR